MTKKKLGQILKEEELITDTQLSLALSNQAITGGLIGNILIELGFTSNKIIAQVFANQLGKPYIDLTTYTISHDVLKLIPKDLCEKSRMIPLALKEDSILIGVIGPEYLEAIDAVRNLTKKAVEVAVIDKDGFSTAINTAYYFLEHSPKEEIEELIKSISHVLQVQTITKARRMTDILPAQKERGKPVEDINTGIMLQVISKLLELLIMEGIRQRATDIHINPAGDVIYIFYRVDGVLQYGYCLPAAIHNPMTSRMKILAGINIAEHRLPQDGSFNYEFLGRTPYDIRVSTIPSLYGENIVLRILPRIGLTLYLSELGFSSEDVNIIKAFFHKTSGIIIIAGPTGSGKTTSLYSALRELDLMEKNVITIEDPIEYKVALAKQTQVNLKVGYDFALAARNFMRQDPDVILIGEIRDTETAKIAIRASITGHLVLTTLHANDAVSAIPRLMDLNVDRFLLTSALKIIISQRLIRRICSSCKTSYNPTDDELDYLTSLGFENNDTFYQGEGCKVCNGTGYSGRIVIGEIMIINKELIELITEGAPIIKIKEAAIKAGTVLMASDGIKKAINGVTTIKEVRRVVS